MSLRLVFYKTINKYHTIAGIFISINLVILLCSGLTLLFKSEIQHTNIVDVSVDQDTFANKYNQANTRLHDVYPNDKPLDIYPDENNPRIIYARLGINGSHKVSESRKVALDYQSGEEIQAVQLPASEFYNWMLSLHEELFMGQRGQIYIGCVGIAFILMNLTGLIKFLKKRRASVHQYLGIICLIWGLIVGMTGALLALNPIFTKHFQENTLKPLAEKYQNQHEISKADASLKTILHTAFNTKPDGVIWYIVYPGMERGIQNHYLILMHGKGIISHYLSEYMLIDAKSAELKEIIQLPILMQLVFIATPFHFVNYGGVLFKIIWATFAVGTLCLAFLGVRSFYFRKKQYVLRIFNNKLQRNNELCKT